MLLKPLGHLSGSGKSKGDAAGPQFARPHFIRPIDPGDQCAHSAMVASAGDLVFRKSGSATAGTCAGRRVNGWSRRRRGGRRADVMAPLRPVISSRAFVTKCAVDGRSMAARIGPLASPGREPRQARKGAAAAADASAGVRLVRAASILEGQ